MQKPCGPNATHHYLPARLLPFFHEAAKIRKVTSKQSAVRNVHALSNVAHCKLLPTAYRQLATNNYICLMEVNDALVDKLAHLARLKFEASQKEAIKNDLQKMIAFVEKLNELDTTDVPPLLHMTTETNVLREDKTEGSITREQALKNAPLHDEKFFKVPKVLKLPGTK
jgi:aspartyl-tRNA(Asn)/glutamyl-tRNA(Gln) amidotransferase subunit C